MKRAKRAVSRRLIEGLSPIERVDADEWSYASRRGR
jgi:hypothetical protein